MSPKEFHALCKARNQIEDRKDRRVATLQAFYLNVNSPKGSRMWSADDFMGGVRKLPERTPDDLLEQQLTAMFGCGPKKEAK